MTAFNSVLGLVVHAVAPTYAELYRARDGLASNRIGMVQSWDKTIPVAGATVGIEGSDRVERTGADGQVRLRGLTPGPATVKVSAEGFRPATLPPKNLPSGVTSLDIPLMGAADLTVEVVDAANKQPINDARIELGLGASKMKLAVDAAGKYRATGIPPQSIQIDASRSMFFSERVEQILKAGPNVVPVALRPQAELAVQVFDAGTRQPIGKATVRISTTGKQATTDRNGKAVFQELPAGPIQLEAGAEGYCDTTVSKQLSAPRTSVEVPLSVGLTVSGTVVDATTNRPVTDALVEVSVADEHGVYRTVKTGPVRTDRMGKYVANGVPAGKAKFRVLSRRHDVQEIVREVSARTAKENVRSVLNPTLNAGEIRVVLTWGKRPRDLDLHLYGKPRTGESFHVSFNNRTAGPATLDVDNKEGEGPETITLRDVPPGKYQCWIQDAANTGVAGDPNLARSGAEVKVYYYGAKEPKTFAVKEAKNAATSPGTVWHACNILVGGSGSIMPPIPAGEFSTNLQQE